MTRFTRTPSLLLIIVCILFLSSDCTPSTSAPASNAATDAFLGCLAVEVPAGLIHNPASSSYAARLSSAARNLRHAQPDTPTPFAVVEAAEHSHVQATVRCARRHGVRVRTRSGGHDYEGVSYASADAAEPFVVLDIGALRGVRVDAARAEAWAGAGATVGELYHALGAASGTFAFPAGVCPSVGLGGHLSGGGVGRLARMYGVGADNVVDALVVDAEGRILDRSAMGEDLFWAIRGGGGGSFGVVLAWKLRLVRVPEKVAVFTVSRSGSPSAVDLVTKWQEVAPALPADVVLRVVLANRRAVFVAQSLGPCRRLLDIMGARFPELGVTLQDCEEMSWVQSTVYNYYHVLADDEQSDGGWRSKPLEELLLAATSRTSTSRPSPTTQAWERTWAAWIDKPEAGQNQMALDPYGGTLADISPSETPFPHRKGNLYQIEYYAVWRVNDDNDGSSKNASSWIQGLYKDMEPYVSKNPKAAYVNNRDMDLGTNQLQGNVTIYEKGRVWGERYFKGNFERLAAVKAMVDPHDFFRHEQSIPPLPSSCTNKFM
ncbi:hypothetical protein U9M48_040357 [Paspalum notatum var. saurae]|uniref:FAD-binding PCMH-type domain-containing protein n=1 Tax=Paspalum notatum var. saurae TaxID=547442 RepID=A0AAQ3ULL9_PASNO